MKKTFKNIIFLLIIPSTSSFAGGNKFILSTGINHVFLVNKNSQIKTSIQIGILFDL